MSAAPKIEAMAKIGPKERKGVQLTVRVPEALAKELEKEASRWRPPLKLATYLRHILDSRHDRRPKD